MQESDGKRDPALKKAHSIKKEYEEELRSKANVTGVGVGYKVVAGKITDQLAVRVYVSKKLPVKSLDAGDVLPKIIDGVPVDVIEADFIVHQDPSIPADHRLRFNPLLGGISVGNLSLGGSGTLGVSVFDNVLAEDMILSNWHVLCGSFTCSQGEIIIQPGQGGGDTGGAGDVVATLYRSALTDEVDGAIARLTGDRFLLKEVFGRGFVSEITTPVLGMRVRKSGRTTGLTSGMITDESANITIRGYPNGDRNFRNQIIIENGSQVSRPGDSGSIWLDDSNRAVGLNFAGSGNRGVANPMTAVVAALNINLKFGITMHDFVAITNNILF